MASRIINARLIAQKFEALLKMYRHPDGHESGPAPSSTMPQME
ncbi:MAG: hypothetical protein AVDCRST_MAG58-749 [uncultured Rubrobacteraceae bacterium]|uniref:Uncharacterized protein n=1 Tax=uncultured Rubrobacteraceae bacterium TaxID=349277 RepID=A0A6J4QNT0_9ACTN|nr:MAG: hypothetical protein AVDCRST_MAG58-749 [uncultured Rubrobacteraceae bacterium]